MRAVLIVALDPGEEPAPALVGAVEDLEVEALSVAWSWRIA